MISPLCYIYGMKLDKDDVDAIAKATSERVMWFASIVMIAIGLLRWMWP